MQLNFPKDSLLYKLLTRQPIQPQVSPLIKEKPPESASKPTTIITIQDVIKSYPNAK